MANIKAGIASIGINLPPLYMTMKSLSKLRHIDQNKYTIGLGCNKMALCPEGYGVVDLAAEAAKRALSRWEGNIEDIGIIAIGTESALDMSRPLSAWVAEKLGLQGSVRSYEVKHACYGGTLAVRQALEWKLAGVAPGKAALVIAADISLYEPGEPSEPTQGAGAVAMVIDKPLIAEIDPISYPWSKPAFDFWRPVGREHPLVEGQFSLHCYQEAASACFKDLIGNKNPEEVLQQFHALCFHTPFPKMVKKAFTAVCKSMGWSDERIESMFAEKVDETMRWNRLSGNNYTASLWLAVANTLRGLQEGKKITAFSYGSGCGAELLTLTAGPLAANSAWAQDIKQDIAHRQKVNAKMYKEMRAKVVHK